jgi:gliding motility-associated-like protein
LIFTFVCNYFKIYLFSGVLCCAVLFSTAVRGQGSRNVKDEKAMRFLLKLQPATTHRVAEPADSNSRAAINGIIRGGTLPQAVITFPVIVNPQLDANSDFNPNATSTNTQTPIVYTSSNTAVATIAANGLVHVVGPGVTTITATQAGNANYAAASPASEQLTVYFGQDVTFPALAAENVCAPDFPAAATSDDPDIPLTYSSSNTAVATISAQGIIHIVGAGTTTITVSQPGQGEYILAATPQTELLTVNPPLIPVVSISANVQTICTGGSVIFAASATNAGANPTYQWQLNGVNAGTNDYVFTTVITSSTDVVQCIVTAGETCVESTTSNQITGITIQAYVTPTISIQSSQTAAVCSGTPITFTATPTNGGPDPAYQWRVNGAGAGTNNPLFTSSSLAQGDTVSCVLVNNGGACITTAFAASNSVIVSIIPPQSPSPSVTITASANNVYVGTSVTFTATPANAGMVTGYQWMVNGKNTGPDSAAFTTTRLLNGDTVTCTITLASGCTVSVTSLPIIVSILPPPILSIPNAFSPNGDGINDVWDIPDLAYYPKCLVNIYNRWGGMVFQSRGYTIAWDGNYKGQILPAGTYYYVINLENKGKPLSGWVALLR